MRYGLMNPVELAKEHESCLLEYDTYVRMGLRLDISRGRPGAEQFSLSEGLLNCVSDDDYLSEDGTDCRNYGGLTGLTEMKRIFAEMLGAGLGDVVAGGNSSLNLMFDCFAAFCERVWSGEVKFICPVPGYDRHFAMCEYFGVKMVPVSMTKEGPDMEEVERIASCDGSVAGMWCVPVFSNPQGYTYSDETVKALAAMKTANENFRLFWDNAYAVHNFRGSRPVIPNILSECASAGKPDRPVEFASFSKISLAGSSVAAFAASEGNRKILLKRLSAQTVGPDKMNQLRHARFFKNLEGVLSHMQKIAEILRPKFDAAEEVFSSCFGETGAVKWTKPDGGYFISADVLFGSARRTEELSEKAGVKVTVAGATYPYGNDPDDQNIRIAPTPVPVEKLRTALEVFCLSAKISELEKRIEAR